MKKMFLLALPAAAIMMAGCWNDNGYDGKPQQKTVEPGTQADFGTIRDGALEALTIHETFDVSQGIIFTTDNGVKFSWSGFLYDSEWNPVTGNVDLEYVEIFDRGSMAAANRPLMGRDSEGNLRPLVTGGEFYVNMTQDGKQLQTWSQYYIEVPGSLTGGVDTGMVIWEGTIDENGDLFWDIFGTGQDRETKAELGIDVENNTYNLFCHDFGWTNIDILSGEQGEKTPLFVKPPHGWDNKNSCVYVAYKGKAGSLAFLDQYWTEEGLFTEHYGWAPIGFQFYVIFAAESDGMYTYWIKEITVAENTIIEVPQSELGTCTREEFIARINALP